MMNELLRKRAIAVMDRIMAHPSASPFLSSVAGDSEEMDLTANRARLQENRYGKLQLWLNDVEQCWANAERRDRENPSSENHHVARRSAGQAPVLAAENRRLFEKEKRAIDILSARNWGTEVVRLRGRITDIMLDPPPKISQYTSQFIKGKFSKPTTPSFSEHELKCFVEASQMLDQPEDTDEMMKIITELQPDMLSASSDMWFDVSKLSPRTLIALRTSARAILERRGQKYPE
jgi:hypothetical protein